MPSLRNQSPGAPRAGASSLLQRHFKTLVQGAIRSGVFLMGREEPVVNSINTIREAFDRWKGALVDQSKQTTPAARHRAHARVTSMEDLIAETPADDIEGVGIKLALYVYMSGVDPETADSAVEQVLSAYKDCVRVLGRDPLAEVKSLMPACQQGV